MAEGEVVYRFPLVVEGNWDCSLSKTLKNKLLCYFQSPKRSGGGECKIHVDPGREKQITVYFAQEDVRQSVLNIKSHELSLPGMKTLKLTVSLPSAEGAPNKNVPLEEQDPSQMPVVAKGSHQLGEQSFVNYSSYDASDYAEKEAGRMAIQEGFSVVVTTDAGSEIQTYILELYFENKRHSGGGPIKSCLKDGQQFIVTFENEADAREVLQRDHHQISKIVLHVKNYQQELKPDPSETSSSLVVLENVPETMIECMLILLVETVSGLSEEDKDFDVEMVPECSAAVITFIKPIETDTFIKTFNQYHRVQQQKISARSLEMPKSILVENIPPDIPEDYIVIYFESKKHGGGLVLENSYIPKDNSAIITFHDSKVVATILQRKHCLMNVPVSVYPYYKSLGAAVYGKERLQIKMPDPFPVSVDPYHWRIQESKEEVEETGEDGNGYGEKQQSCYEVKLGNDIVVILQKADLTQCSADVIVNASNEELMHIGGLASRLLEAAGPELQKECQDQHSTAKIRADPETVMTAEGLKILLKKKGIEEATTDVIVNSVARDLQLDKGPLSRALLAKAGAELQVELTQEGQGKDIKEGCVLKTSGYALSCRHVLHAVLPAWNQKKKLENKNLGGIIEECLKVAEQLSLSSITFPAIGTGNLGYPKEYVAKLFFDEVFKFSQAENPKSLKEVHFVLHASDTTTVQAFMEELNSRLSVSQTSSSMPKASSENFQQENQAFSEQSSTLKYGNLKTQIGSLELQLEQGDITKQMTDAIVNITNQTFNLQTGVSKAIMESAGPEVVKECADLASQPHNNLICTQGGNLSCKNIIHLVNSNDIKKQVSQALMECEQRQFTSVAFPAIGTGYAKRDPVIAADSMIDAIVDYASTTSAPGVREIKIIIFQSHLLEVFYASTQRTEVTASKPSGGTRTQKSFFSKVAEFFTTKKPAVELKPALVFERTVEPAVFQICGDHYNNVENAAAWIKKLIFESQNEYTISDEWISNFGESEYKKLEDLQEMLHIALKLDSEASPPSLCICGITKDVLQASMEIQTMIRRIREDREEKSKADLLTNLVLWRYEDNGQYRTFDSLTNMQLEAAAQHQRQYELTINKKRYKVDPSKMQAVDDQGTCITLRRVAKVEDNPATAIPEEWDAMEETMRVKVVELKSEMKEYKKVQDMFNQTSKGYTIQKIERIQNPFYWQAYQIKKQEMDAKNGKVNNEMLLFHGTASTSLTLINSTGFNRSYAGLHAACFGNGTYFAVNASYSAHNTYSQPDASGTKYIQHLGSMELLTPPFDHQLLPCTVISRRPASMEANMPV
ncbi:polyADP-ribose polymerase PARP14 [Crotalus adamanteus]|uniref:Poly [ADP-ribose] polymerase n=1 Tax=Crotalus adamanteus TaxID=8729 RepID=A0AAW1C8A0_CROAD